MPNLERFLEAQERAYETALEEVRAGQKESHWIWYVFPQVRGLGCSSTAKYYAIADLEEAKEYMAEPVLRARLLEVSEALLGLSSSNASVVMGYPDDLKLRSSMTLFSVAAPEEKVFQQVLDKFFDGTPDGKTLEILGL